MNIENVAGEGFMSRRTPEQKREFAIGAGVVGKIVIDNQDIASFSMKYSAMLVAA